MEVVEDEQQPLCFGGVQQQPDDGVEELVPRALARALAPVTTDGGAPSSGIRLANSAAVAVGSRVSSTNRGRCAAYCRSASTNG